MKKYYVLATQVFSRWVMYRFSIISGILQSFITPLIMIMALNTAKPISNVSIWDLLPYYVTISLIYSVVRSDVDDTISNYADSGEINNFLVKPLGLYKYLITQEISKGIITIFTIAIPLGIYFLLNNKPEINLLAVFFTFISIILAFIIYFSLSYFVGLFCFWIELFWAIHNIKFVSIQFLGGIVLPYTFFPDQFRRYLEITPFPYIVS